MDARERLKRYLEQRRELGERELVLDGLSVDDVMALVSAKGALRQRPRGASLPHAAPAPEAPARDARALGEDGGETPRGSALPSAFAPTPGADDAEDEEPGEESLAADDHGAPADHPRLRGEGSPAPADGPRPLERPGPRGPEPERTERGARTRDLPLDGADTGDWRTTLRASGAADAPASRAPQPPSPTPPVEETPPVPARRPAADGPTPAIAAGGYVSGTPFPGLGDVTTGVIYTGGDAPLFGDDIGACASLGALAELVRGCTRCPLYRTATHGVPGEGNPDADFVVVGEAPGADEDASGRPFVGASGQLLTKILAAINLAREDVFICNVVKHRPPGNRNPAPDEVAACSPYLIRQLELVRPKVILTVGNFAAQTLLQTKLGIGKLRGQVHLYRGVPLVATYHPAALLRNPNWKRPTWEDVQLARRLFDRAAAPG